MHRNATWCCFRVSIQKKTLSTVSALNYPLLTQLTRSLHSFHRHVRWLPPSTTGAAPRCSVLTGLSSSLEFSLLVCACSTSCCKYTVQHKSRTFWSKTKGLFLWKLARMLWSYLINIATSKNCFKLIVFGKIIKYWENLKFKKIYELRLLHRFIYFSPHFTFKKI